MGSIVDWFGCDDAVAVSMNARWGRGASKGTISKEVSERLDWALADVIALEDASGRFPITRLMARRLENRVVMANTSLIRQSAVIAKESGEAISAILAAEQSNGAHEKEQAIKEIDDVLGALGQTRLRLESNDNGAAP